MPWARSVLSIHGIESTARYNIGNRPTQTQMGNEVTQSRSSMVTYHESIFVGGNHTAPSTDKRFTVISPWTEQPVASVPEGARADIDRAVEAAADAQRCTPWGITVPEERPAMMKRLADTYERRKDEIAEAMTLEMGCPVSQVFAMHVDPAVRVMHFYADLAAT